MKEEEKIASLNAAQRMFLWQIERELEKYKTLKWLVAKPTLAPVDDVIVWAREIEGERVTLALTATRESLEAKTISIRAVGRPGHRFALKDVVCGLQDLYKTLTDLTVSAPMTPSTRRPNQPLRRSRPRRGR